MAEVFPELTVVEVDEHHAKATSLNMLFTLWVKETRLDAYQRLGRILQKHAKNWPNGVGLLQVVEPSALPPDALARAEFLKFLKAAEKSVKHYGTLHEGIGFKAASVRAVISSANLFTRPTFKTSVFSSLVDAAAWHAGQQRILGHKEGTRHIIAVVRELREIQAAYRTDKPDSDVKRV